MKNKLIIGSTLCVSLLATTVTPAFAETTPSTTQGTNQKRVQAKVNACDQINTQIEKHREKIDLRAEKTQLLFEKHDARLAELTTKAQNKGIDVSNLEIYLTEWKSYTEEIKDKRIATKSHVESAQQLICDGDREAGRTKLGEARGIVTEIRQIQLDRRIYYIETIVPELKNIRDQLRVNTTEKNNTTRTSRTNQNGINS